MPSGSSPRGPAAVGSRRGAEDNRGDARGVARVGTFVDEEPHLPVVSIILRRPLEDGIQRFEERWRPRLGSLYAASVARLLRISHT